MTRTTLYRSSRFAEHDDPSHVENQRRLTAIDAALDRSGLLEGRPQPELIPASVEQLARVHEPAYIQALAEAAAQGGGWIDGDTYMGFQSVEVAALAAGASVQAVDAALSGSAVKGFVLARPPGHHARPMIGMGFCLFDTIAIGAAEALAQGIERIAIVDWDVHHGNGTQEIFYETDRVFFTSMHQWPLYPGTGAASETGYGAGAGYTLNVPLPAGSGNDDYLRTLDEFVLPRLRDYRPELVLVSAGYDCHRDDPLGSMLVDEDGFGVMTARLVDLAETYAGGRIVLVLEGGYHPAALARSVVRTIEVLDGAV
ncbi:MAG: histone deacetylase [Thermomicrobiales bacterium]|nr:histone deacetylase [Thermomicrobiales bacterium]MCO5220017.1 histone deacetylase [Thermomicrobiales bacterium]